MAASQKSHDKLTFDSHLLEVYLTGLQAEVEAKLRRVGKFRELMRKVDAAGGKTDTEARERAAFALSSSSTICFKRTSWSVKR